MKNRDTYELFEVFKPGYMDDATFFQKLIYWFKSVYWYHFKKQTLLALCGLILLGVFIADISNHKNNDLDFILGGDTAVSSQAMDALSNKLKASIDDVNGDKKVDIGYQMLCTESIYESPDAAQLFDQVANASIEKIQISFANDETLLFILDKNYIEWYAKDGAFEPLKKYGVKSDNKYYVRVDNTKLFKKLGITNSNGWYAAIKVKNQSRSKNKKILKKYDAAVKSLKAILE